MKCLLFLIFFLQGFSLQADENIEKHTTEVQEDELFVNLASIDYSLYKDLCNITKISSTVPHSNLEIFSLLVEQGNTTAPTPVVRAALEEAAACLEASQGILSDNEIERIAHNIEDYYNSLTTRSIKNKFFGGNVTIAGSLTTRGNSMISGNETIRGNLAVLGNETVNGTLSVGALQIAGNQTSNLSSCNVILAAASAGASTASSCGLLELGGINPSTTNVNFFETGTRNVFGGNYSTVPNVTGNDNTALGLNALSAITSGTNNIAIGANSNILTSTASGTISIGCITTASADNAIAIGSASIVGTGATAQGSASIAIGSCQYCFSGATAQGNSSVAIGAGSQSTQEFNTSFGPVATATGYSAAALGPFANASGNFSLATGPTAVANGAGSIAVGASTASNATSISIGSSNFPHNGATSSGVGSIAIGGSTGTDGATSSGEGAIALGSGTSATSLNGVSIGSAQSSGQGANCSGNAGVAIGGGNSNGPGAIASGLASVAIGGADGLTGTGGASASAGGAIAIGVYCQASFIRAMALGNSASSSATDAIAVGTGARASGVSSLALGSSTTLGYSPASSYGLRSLAIGSGSSANSTDSIALGTNCTASANNTVAIGTHPLASSAGAISIGSNATSINTSASTASGASSIAVGSGGATNIGANATAAAATAIGGGNAGGAGASASGIGSIAFGGSDGTSAGASSAGLRSVAIGTGSSVNQTDAIILGNSTNAAVRVGIGTNAPTARLQVAGVGGTPVATFNAGDNTAPSQITFTNVQPTGAAANALQLSAAGSGNLQYLTSTRKVKQNIRAMQNESQILYQLQPVVYDTKPGYGEGKDIPGFIAEEVHAIAPGLALLDLQGEPANIAYPYFHALAVKELQKHQQTLHEILDRLQRLEDRIR